MELDTLRYKFVAERLQLVNDKADVTEAPRVAVTIVVLEFWVTLSAMIMGQLKHSA